MSYIIGTNQSAVIIVINTNWEEKKKVLRNKILLFEYWIKLVFPSADNKWCFTTKNCVFYILNYFEKIQYEESHQHINMSPACAGMGGI